MPHRLRNAASVFAACLSIWSSTAIAQETPAAAPASPAPAGTEAAPASPPAAPAVEAPPAAIELPWDQKPYNVEIEVSFAGDARLDDRFRTALISALADRLTDDLGRMWSLSISEATGDAYLPAAQLARLTDEDAKTRWMSHTADKVFALCVGRTPQKTTFDVREWDRTAQQMTPVRSGETFDSRLAAGVASATIRETFRALAQVESVDGKSAILRLRAGELLPPDQAAAQFAVGDLAVPFYRQLDRKREVKRVQHIPWTYLKIENIERGRVTSSIVSTFPGAVMAGKRRLESMAIEIRAWHPQTELKVAPRSNPGNPIAAARVDVVDRLPTAADPVPDRLELRTNRDGIITVPAEATAQIRFAIVNSGQAVLARVPFSPGAQKSLTIETIDDGPRLSVEGEVSLLEADLVELVARRQILGLRAEAAIKAGKGEEAQSLVAQLKALPDQKSFQQRVELVRTAGVEAAKAKKDTVAETRIRKLCGNLTEVATTHLDQDKFAEQLRNLEEMAGLSGGKS